MYQVTVREYYVFQFMKLNHNGRTEYQGEKERIKIYKELSSDESYSLFHDKYQTFLRFADYFGRKVLFFDETCTYEKFILFSREIQDFVVKPTTSTCGKGILFRHFCDNNEKMIEIYKEISLIAPCLLEEKVIQAPEMADFHHASVNTVRIVTIYSKSRDESKIIQATFRMGVGEAHVDNAGSGGICASIDIQTGVVYSVGHNELSYHKYIYHPDTGKQIVGFHIPEWETVCKLAKQLSLIVKEQKIVGWDFAYTDNGWIMIEGNERPAIQFLAEPNFGIRSVMTEAIKYCNS